MRRNIEGYWICINVFVKSRDGKSIYKSPVVVYEGAIKKKRNPHVSIYRLASEKVELVMSDRIGCMYRMVKGGIRNEGYRKVY